jgi:hypothetical protein
MGAARGALKPLTAVRLAGSTSEVTRNYGTSRQLGGEAGCPIRSRACEPWSWPPRSSPRRVCVAVEEIERGHVGRA